MRGLVVAALLLLTAALPVPAAEADTTADASEAAAWESPGWSPLPEETPGVDCDSRCILLALKTLCRLKDLIQGSCQETCEEICGEGQVSFAQQNCGVCTCSCDLGS